MIAFWAVSRQIAANAATVAAQIEANAAAVATQIAADRSERRRAERLGVTTDGAALVDELAQIAANYEYFSGKTGGPLDPKMQQLELEKFYRLEVLPTTRRMSLLGMPMTSEAVEAVYKEARIVMVPFPSDAHADASTVAQKKDRALSVLKSSLEQEVTPPQVLATGARS